MHTPLDCLPCLLTQCLSTARRAGNCEDLQRRIMTEMARRISAFDPLTSPPENAMGLYARIAELAGSADLFAELKEQSNQLALSMRPRQATRIAEAADPLRAALKLAIAGNVIDYGAPHQLDLHEMLATALSRPLAIDHYHELQQELTRAENVLYLADNCGELVFDSLLIERLGKKVTLATKERPIINDALVEDALHCGLDRHCEIITNGTGCPGTPLASCSPAFRQAFQEADLIISKGQGNFETLSTTPGPIYFLLTVKCRVVAAHLAELAGIRVRVGEPVLFKGQAAA
jgi:damage-control phosphatase, subfamily I